MYKPETDPQTPVMPSEMYVVPHSEKSPSSLSEVILSDSEQEKWLLSLLGEADTPIFLQLPPHKLDTFVQQIGDTYKATPLQGVPLSTKETRIEMLSMFLKGESYNEVARICNRGTREIKQSLDKIRKFAADKVPQSGLQLLAQDPGLYVVPRHQKVTPRKPRTVPSPKPETTYSTTQDRIKKIGYYSVVLLAELEDKKTLDISAPENIAAIRHATGITSNKVLNNNICALNERGLAVIEGNDDTKKLLLTDEGKLAIDYLKDNLDSLRITEPSEKLIKGTSYRILDLIADLTDGNIEKAIMVEEGSSIFSYLATLLDISEDAVTRRLFSLAREKGYITVIKHIISSGHDESEGHEIIAGVSITRQGLDYLRRVQERFADKDTRSEAQVWELDQATETCLELATELDDHTTLEALKKLRDEKHFFEMSELELKSTQRQIFKTLDELRQKYVYEKAAAA